MRGQCAIDRTIDDKSPGPAEGRVAAGLVAVQGESVVKKVRETTIVVSKILTFARNHIQKHSPPVGNLNRSSKSGLAVV